MGLYSNFQDNVSIIKPKKAKRLLRGRFAFLGFSFYSAKILSQPIFCGAAKLCYKNVF
jgi:hypothetical protein